MHLHGADSYVQNWHVDALAAYLESCRFGDIKRLIINLPPRSLKSITASVAWPSWILGHKPCAKIICASYSQELAEKLALDCRMIMSSSWYRALFPDVRIIREQNSKRKFQTTEGGFRLATSVGAALIGEGADYIIVDDPQNFRQSQSFKNRESVIGWFEGSLLSRLNDKANGVVTLVMQRLHVDDLSGHLLKSGRWDHLNLPAIAETVQVIECGKFSYGRGEGEVLNPARESLETLENLKQEMGSIAFSAQYQQNPVPRGGGMIKADWFGRYRAYPSAARIIQSWDTGIKANSGADPSCLTTWAVADDALYLLDVYREKLEYPDLKRMAVLQAKKWCPHVILIEDKASGQSLLQDLKSDSHLPILPIKPTTDKVNRLSSALGLLESGRVRLPEQAPWLPDFMLEVLTFPSARHDDQVDSLTQLLNWLRTSDHLRPGLRGL